MTVGNENWLLPDWPAPARVRACVTTRQGGVSAAPFDSFNLGDHVGDDPAAVACNRQHLRDVLGCQPIWLEQVHSSVAVKALPGVCATADASWSETPGEACAVLTADCLPVLFCDRAASRVAAAHAGWRGLAGGVLETTLEALAIRAEDVLVWLGPAIGPAAFELGARCARHSSRSTRRLRRHSCRAATRGASWPICISLRAFAWLRSESKPSTAVGCAPSAIRVSIPIAVPHARGASPV